MAKNKQLVLAFFPGEAAADKAVDEFNFWDEAENGTLRDAIGVIVKDDKDKVKTHKLGRRAPGEGAGIGVILGLIAAIPTGGLSLLAGTTIGAVGGATIGVFYHHGLGLSQDDLARIGKELDGGKAAVGVLCADAEAQAVSDKLVELGGKPETHAVTEEALTQAATVAAQVPEVVPPAAGSETKK